MSSKNVPRFLLLQNDCHENQNKREHKEKVIADVIIKRPSE